MSTSSRNNVKTATLLSVLAAGMVGLAFASVPLYQLFCQVTGYGGTTVTGIKPIRTVDEDAPVITVLFDSNVETALPWSFTPDQNKIRVRIGEENLVSYTVKNLGHSEIVGNATFNVTPHKAGQYFQKIECFCFQKQPLEKRELKRFPLQLYISPKIPKHVNRLTLAYTLFDITP